MQLSPQPDPQASHDAPTEDIPSQEAPTQNDSSDTNPKEDETTEEGRKIVQYIRDLYDSGAKLWTKDMFRDAEREMARDPRPRSIQVRSMNGEITQRRVPAGGATYDGHTGLSYVDATFRVYQDLVYSAKRLYSYDFDLGSDGLKVRSTLAFTVEESWTTDPPIVEYHELMELWDKARDNWTQSSAHAQLIAAFNEAPVSDTTNKVVGFGLGTLEYDNEKSTISHEDGLPAYGPITQHLAAHDVAVLLGDKLGLKQALPVIVQDPGYSEVSKRLLAEKGIEVLGGIGSLGFTFVDDNSVVFAFAPNIPVKQVIADIARPAAMVWDRVTDSSEDTDEIKVEVINGRECKVMPWTTDHDSPRTRKLVEDYQKYDFSAGKLSFGDAAIYVRRGDE